MNKTIEDQVTDVLKKVLSTVPDISTDACLIESLGLDSLHFLKLLTELEKEFDIYIADDYWDGDRLNTLQSIIDYVELKLRGEQDEFL